MKLFHHWRRLLIPLSATLGGLYGLIAAVNQNTISNPPWMVVVSIVGGAAICCCGASALSRGIGVWQLIRESQRQAADFRSADLPAWWHGSLIGPHKEQFRSRYMRGEISPKHQFKLDMCQSVNFDGRLDSIHHERVSQRRLKHLMGELVGDAKLN